ncbi:MAG: LptF/LptG family permease [Candidatus Omnitrophica bacterium]|nr:LptF/LptG family permease [Candidatus Omnitrophota bacterium]
MKILDRYLGKAFFVPFMICILTFSSVAIVIDLFNRLDEILKLHTPLTTLLVFYLHFIPFTFVQTSPIAVLVACLYSVGLLNKHHELTAMRASGLSLARILSPLLFLGLLVGAVSFVVNETVVPSAMVKLTAIKEEKLEVGKTSKGKVLKNVALFAEEGDLYYATTFEPKKKLLRDLVILRDNEQHIPILKIQAREARWAEGSWILSRGSKYRLDLHGKIIGEPILFIKERFPSSAKPEEFLKARLRTEMMNTRELRAYLKKLKGKAAPSVIRRIMVELHQKIAFPFVNVVTILIGFPFVFREKRGTGILRGVGISGVLSFTFYASFIITSNLGTQGILLPWLSVWITHFVFGAAGILLLWQAR